MLPLEQMRMGAQVLAAIFGGPGIFYLWRSFGSSGDALNAALYLAIATTLILVAGAPSRTLTPARRRLPFSRKRRP
jgi:hypothetical protein